LAIPYGSKKEMHNLYYITEIKRDKRGTGLKELRIMKTYKNLRNQDMDAVSLKNEMTTMADEKYCKHMQLQYWQRSGQRMLILKPTI
jgi:hypothetical protein